jgi:ribonuclease-3
MVRDARRPAGAPARPGALEKRLGHKFRDPALLTRALTHSSHVHESGEGVDNEQLEFLGDALLGFLIAEALTQLHPAMDEGGWSKFKAYLVSGTNLAVTAKRLGLGSHLHLGRTVEKGRGRSNDSLLGNALEAVIAAVHLDGGDEAARRLVQHLFGAQLRRLDRSEVEGKDYKTTLQERLQAGGRPTPRYRVDATEGPPHQPRFHISLLIDGEVVARARGANKKEAEQRAARRALKSVAPAEEEGVGERQSRD